MDVATVNASSQPATSINSLFVSESPLHNDVTSSLNDAFLPLANALLNAPNWQPLADLHLSTKASSTSPYSLPAAAESHLNSSSDNGFGQRSPEVVTGINFENTGVQELQSGRYKSETTSERSRCIMSGQGLIRTNPPNVSLGRSHCINNQDSSSKDIPVSRLPTLEPWCLSQEPNFFDLTNHWTTYPCQERRFGHFSQGNQVEHLNGHACRSLPHYDHNRKHSTISRRGTFSLRHNLDRPLTHSRSRMADSKFGTSPPRHYYCRNHPNFMTRIYCLTHGHTICCTCASSVLGTHGECSLTPKNGSSSPLFLTLVRKVDVILELVVNNMRKANVDMIRLAVPGENDLINAQFRSTPLLSNSEQVSTFLESLNSLLRSMGIGRSSFTYLRRKLLYCEEQFHMLPSLYHIEKPCNVNSSQVAKHIEFVGQGVRKATCGVKTKFYIKFLDEAGHRCHVATHNFRAEASMPDGLKFDVQVSQTKMPGVLEASYTCNQPGKLQLKLIQCFEQEKICCRVVTVKMNKFSRMEVKRHLCDDDFNNPWGICISVKGDIFVSDRCNHSIKVFGPNLTFKNSISEFGTENGKLNKPAGIAFDNNSDLVVCDKDNHRIQVFTAAGEFVRSSSRCDEAFLLQYPWGIAVNSQNKYIVSHSKFKISIMDSHFCGLMNIFAAPSQLIRPRSPRGICVDELDQIFFTDFENSEVFQTANEKHYYETFINTCDQRKFFDETQPRCQNVAIDSEGNFVITKSKINSVQFRSNAGAFQGELRIYGKPMTAIEMPGRAGYYMVTMVDSSYGLAIIGPRKIREMRRVSRLREYLNHSALS